MRFGTTTDEDWRWMQHRRLSDITLRDGVQGTLFRDARTLWLVPMRVLWHTTILERLEELYVQLVTSQGIQYGWMCHISSKDTGKMAGKMGFKQLEDFASLPAQTFLC